MQPTPPSQLSLLALRKSQLACFLHLCPVFWETHRSPVPAGVSLERRFSFPPEGRCLLSREHLVSAVRFARSAVNGLTPYSLMRLCIFLITATVLPSIIYPHCVPNPYNLISVLFHTMKMNSLLLSSKKHFCSVRCSPFQDS